MNRLSISISRALAFSSTSFRRHYGLFAAALLIIVGAWVATEVAVVVGQRLGILWWVSVHVAFLVFFAGIQIGLIRICLFIYDGRAPTFADLFSQVGLWPVFLAGQLVYLSLVVIGLAVLVVPGVYLAARYCLFGFAVASGESTLWQGFHKSAALTAGAKTNLFGIFLALLVFNAFGAALLGIGLFITAPISLLIMTAIYRQLGARSPATAA